MSTVVGINSSIDLTKLKSNSREFSGIVSKIEIGGESSSLYTLPNVTNVQIWLYPEASHRYLEGNYLQTEEMFKGIEYILLQYAGKEIRGNLYPEIGTIRDLTLGDKTYRLGVQIRR